jgi:hypothetical protein
MYVKERRADSIWDTALEFLMMKSPYDATHFGGRDNACDVCPAACLYSSNIFAERYGAHSKQHSSRR